MPPLAVNTSSSAQLYETMAKNLRKAHGTMREVLDAAPADKENVEAESADHAAPLPAPKTAAARAAAWTKAPEPAPVPETPDKATALQPPREIKKLGVRWPPQKEEASPCPERVEPAAAPAPTVYRSGWSAADRTAGSTKRHNFSGSP